MVNPCQAIKDKFFMNCKLTIYNYLFLGLNTYFCEKTMSCFIKHILKFSTWDQCQCLIGKNLPPSETKRDSLNIKNSCPVYSQEDSKLPL